MTDNMKDDLSVRDQSGVVPMDDSNDDKAKIRSDHKDEKRPKPPKGSDRVDIAGLMEKVSANIAAQMRPMVADSIREYLQANGIVPDKVSAKQNVFENPPIPSELAAAPDDGYERIIVGVTQADIEMGKNKLHEMQALGWVVERTVVEGARYIMKAPKDHVRKIRQAAEQLHRQWTKPRPIAVGSEIKSQGGSDVKQLEEPTVESFSTQEIAEMAASGVVPITHGDD